MTQRTKVHLSPWLLLLDVIAVLVLILGVHDVLRPETPWAAMQFPFEGGAYVLLGSGIALMVVSLVTMIRQFSGPGLLASDDL